MSVAPASDGPAMERGRPDREERQDSPSGAPKASPEQRARLFKRISFFAAPLIIAALGLLLYFYYQSLDLENAGTSLRSPLDWDTKLWPQTLRILEIAFWSTLIVIAVAIPLGVLLTRPSMRRIGPVVLTIANSGQAFPAYGLLVLFLLVLPTGQGMWTAIWALAVYALLPVLRNTMVGLQGVDKSVIEAGRGMGMTRAQALTRIELPLAVPVILAGVRTAMILNIGMAALAFLIGGGGLGITINAGLKLNQDPVLIIGAGLMALVALTFDWFGALAERFLKPKGI